MKKRLLIICTAIGLSNFSCDEQGFIVANGTEAGVHDEFHNADQRLFKEGECVLADAAITNIKIDYDNLPPYIFRPDMKTDLHFSLETSNLGRVCCL